MGFVVYPSYRMVIFRLAFMQILGEVVECGKIVKLKGEVGSINTNRP